MNAVQGMPAADPRVYASPLQQANPQSRRSEVSRLSASLDQLHKALMDHADRIDPILRPQSPMANAGAVSAQPESRLASEVTRINDLCDMVARLTERVEA